MNSPLRHKGHKDIEKQKGSRVKKTFTLDWLLPSRPLCLGGEIYVVSGRARHRRQLQSFQQIRVNKTVSGLAFGLLKRLDRFLAPHTNDAIDRTPVVAKLCELRLDRRS